MFQASEQCWSLFGTFLCYKNNHRFYTDISNYLSVDNGLIVSWFTPTTLVNLELDNIINGMVTECIVVAATKIGANPFYGETFNLVYPRIANKFSLNLPTYLVSPTLWSRRSYRFFEARIVANERTRGRRIISGLRSVLQHLAASETNAPLCRWPWRMTIATSRLQRRGERRRIVSPDGTRFDVNALRKTPDPSPNCFFLP